jgi:urease accessory protein
MTLYVNLPLGHIDEPRFAGRRIVGVSVAWDEALRRRLRRQAADGTDVAIDLDRAAFLADGLVLDDDGKRVIVVSRPLEQALVVRFDLSLPPERLLAQAVAVGHAFGNQHVPVDLVGGEVRVPLTTSEEIARTTVEALFLEGAVVSVEDVALGRSEPMSAGHAHAQH